MDIRSMSDKGRSGDMPRYVLKLSGVKGIADFVIEPVYDLNKVTTIGRAVENTITIEDDFLSATHARIIRKRKNYYLQDDNSTNGTFLNGKRLGKRRVRLKDGDQIHLGRCEFLFVMEKGQVSHESI